MESEQNLDELALVRAAATGDAQAWSSLVARFDTRLRRMVHLRFNPRLRGRVDENDVLQEAWLAVHRQLGAYLTAPVMSPFLWVRHLTGLKLTEVHRRHLGTDARDANRELTLNRGGLPESDSASLAAMLVGALTSPSQAALKAELRSQVQTALAELDPLDREILALKHFEQLSTAQVAEVLGLSKSGAGHRYVKAIKQLRALLEQLPGFSGC